MVTATPGARTLDVQTLCKFRLAQGELTECQPSRAQGKAMYDGKSVSVMAAEAEAELRKALGELGINLPGLRLDESGVVPLVVLGACNVHAAKLLRKSLVAASEAGRVGRSE